MEEVLNVLEISVHLSLQYYVNYSRTERDNVVLAQVRIHEMTEDDFNNSGSSFFWHDSIGSLLTWLYTLLLVVLYRYS